MVRNVKHFQTLDPPLLGKRSWIFRKTNLHWGNGGKSDAVHVLHYSRLSALKSPIPTRHHLSGIQWDSQDVPCLTLSNVIDGRAVCKKHAPLNKKPGSLVVASQFFLMFVPGVWSGGRE